LVHQNGMQYALHANSYTKLFVHKFLNKEWNFFAL